MGIYSRVILFFLGIGSLIYPGPLVRASAQPQNPSTIITLQNRQIWVNGSPFIIRGVGYAPTPIGQDPETTSPNGDYFTSAYSSLYNKDLPLIRDMGANTVRLWGWNYKADHTAFLDAAYNHGSRPIYVIVTYWLNASLNLSDPVTRQQLIGEFTQMVALNKKHPAVLMWMIGNELNAPWMYGNSDALFSLINDMALAAHKEEGANFHPVTTPLADIDLINTIAQRDAQTPNLDVWSAQIYRGKSFSSVFTDYAAVSAKPFVITEYGIDAYDDVHGNEYEKIGEPYQALYDTALWKEIAVHSDISSGGSVMAYSDEWWKGKYGAKDAGHPNCPDPDPLLHSACGNPSASFPDGYGNEEWWGLMRTLKNGSNPDSMQPRAVYYAFQSLWLKQIFLPAISH